MINRLKSPIFQQIYLRFYDLYFNSWSYFTLLILKENAKYVSVLYKYIYHQSHIKVKFPFISSCFR